MATVPAAAGVHVSKRARLDDQDGNGLADVGERIEYSFEVTNTGNVTLTDVTVDDGKAGPVSCPSGPLAPGAVIRCSAAQPYVVVQADLDDGAVVNRVTASGLPPTGSRVTSPEAREVVATPPRDPGIALVKTGRLLDANGNGWADRGEVVEYRFTITNIGNVTVADVRLADSQLAQAPCSRETLAPAPRPGGGQAEEATCGPVQYRVTEADVTRGYVHNEAVASGTRPGGGRVESLPSTVDIPSLQRIAGSPSRSRRACSTGTATAWPTGASGSATPSWCGTPGPRT